MKTILVHLGDDADNANRLATALNLARAQAAHLSGLYITRPRDLPPEVAGRAASIAYLQESTARAQESAQAVETAFREACARARVPHDWIMEESFELPSLAVRSHAADLIIVSRGEDRYLEDRLRLRLSEELVMVTGLPVLLLPLGLPPVTPGRRILIAWKPTREAVRAIRDSLPLLATAEAVYLATVRPGTGDAIAALAVQQYLERHGVAARTLDLEAPDSDTGQTLLDAATAQECDMIVLGAYGHSRLRELILGGVTRTLVRESRLPLLLSH